MTKIIATISLLAISLISYSQKTTIKTIKGGYILHDFVENIYGFSFSINKTYPNYVLAVKPNYATTVFKVDSILKRNQPEYMVNLAPITSIDNTVAKKKIVFSGFKDPSKKVNLINTLSQVQVESVNACTPDYENIVREKLYKAKFNTQSDDDIFKQKKINADFVLSGEFLECERNSKNTPGFKILVVIKWSVYDVKTEELLLSFITGGFSNSHTKKIMGEEFKLAIEDAVGGIIVNKDLFSLLSNKQSLENSNQKKILIQYGISKISPENVSDNIQKSTIEIACKASKTNGFIINSEGYIVTDYNSIKDSTELMGTCSNGLTLPMKLITFDSNNNVALCKLLGGGYSYIPIDTTSINTINDNEVFAISSPADSKVILNNLKGKLNDIQHTGNNIIYLTDLLDNNQNSSTILVNKKGEIIGVKIKSDVDGKIKAISSRSLLKLFNIDFKKSN